MQVHGIGKRRVVWVDREALQHIVGPPCSPMTMLAVPVKLDNGACMAAGFCDFCKAWTLVRRSCGIQAGLECPERPHGMGCQHRVHVIQAEPVERRLTRKERFGILRRDGYRCRLCGQTSDDGARLEVDHKTPLVRGGTDADENLWTLCQDCNRGKGADEL